VLEETWNIIESFDKKPVDSGSAPSQVQETSTKAGKRTFDEEKDAEAIDTKKVKKNEEDEVEKGEKFDWLEVIRSELQVKGEMKLKKLQKKVIKKYQSLNTDSESIDEVKLIKKLNKKLDKYSQIFQKNEDGEQNSIIKLIES